MDEMVLAAVGGAAAVAVLGRGLRPVAKVMMRGAVVAGETAAAGKRNLQGLYDEVKAERGETAPQATVDAARHTEPPPAEPSPATG